MLPRCLALYQSSPERATDHLDAVNGCLVLGLDTIQIASVSGVRVRQGFGVGSMRGLGGVRRFGVLRFGVLYTFGGAGDFAAAAPSLQ